MRILDCLSVYYKKQTYNIPYKYLYINTLIDNTSKFVFITEAFPLQKKRIKHVSISELAAIQKDDSMQKVITTFLLCFIYAIVGVITNNGINGQNMR